MKYKTSFVNPDKLTNKNLQTIIQFYLFECPVEGKSYRGKSFKEYGYNGSASFSKLKTALLDSATLSLRKNYKPSKKEELKQNYASIETVCYPDEYCVFLKSYEKSVIRSMFAAIRNAFAHGSYNVEKYKKTRIYYFSNYKDYEKARMVLHEETLLSWIRIIKEKGGC